MGRKPEIGNVRLYPDRPLRASDKNGYQLKFYCPIRQTRIRRNCGARDRREARRIVKECRERLLNGKYVESGGAITESEAALRAAPWVSAHQQIPESTAMTWDAAYEHFRNHRKRRLRRKASRDSDSRIDIAGRVFEARRADAGLPPGATLQECMTLAALEYLQDQLLEGAEGRFEFRSPNTVNSMMGAVMTFVRFCFNHDWIERVPSLNKIDVDEVMRGRPIATEEFERMLEATPLVVGDGAAASWRFTLKVLWESGFRIGDVMDFAWDDDGRIRPRWPQRKADHPTIIIPSTQKNGKNDEIPMLPELRTLLEVVPPTERTGFVVNPLPIAFTMQSQGTWFMPQPTDLESLIEDFSNCAIAKACGVSEQTVRNWLRKLALQRRGNVRRYGDAVPDATTARLRKRAACQTHQVQMAERLTVERVSRIIAAIGEAAKVVVRKEDPQRGHRTKYASAHDLRRSLAERLINRGVSAETLMVVMRHKDFATTRKFYGAKKAAQSAAEEIHEKSVARDEKRELVGGLMGGNEKPPQLTAEEVEKLKSLLNSI
jgi:integrase